MSELSEVKLEYGRVIPEKFGGLSPEYALKRAQELLDEYDVAIYLEPHLARGVSAAELAQVLTYPVEAVEKNLEGLAVQLATLHLQHSLGDSALIVANIRDAEKAASKVTYTSTDDYSTDR